MRAAKAFRFAERAGRLPRLASPSLPASSPREQVPSPPEQANAGRAAYQSKCASCHLPDLKGSNEAPPLAGGNFMNTWRNRAASELFDRIRNTMPMSNPGSLSDEEAVKYRCLYSPNEWRCRLAHRRSRRRQLVPIGSVASGAATEAAQQAAAQIPAAPASAPARASGAPAALTVAGEVKNYVPVTDEMLVHPDPADWLMVRGNYQAWNHSALTQITRGKCEGP